MQGGSDWDEDQKSHVYCEVEHLLVAERAAEHAEG
jgi:hypothetical protein